MVRFPAYSKTIMKKVLILIDGRNFEQGIINLAKKRNEFRFVDFHKIKNFILEYLANNPQYRGIQLFLVRTYFYTGEYTDDLIKKIEKQLEKDKENKKLIDLLEHSKRKYQIQTNFIKFSKSYYFFELRLKPLQFSSSDCSIFQKGVDVQLAADLVDFTHKNIFDIAVLLSGDIDLLESIKITKNQGKQVIIFGDSKVTAEEMKKYADMFVDIGRFSEEQLDKFSHNPNKKEKINQI